MNNTIQLEHFSQDELKNFLINIHEKYWVELKKSSDLPVSFSGNLFIVQQHFRWFYCSWCRRRASIQHD